MRSGWRDRPSTNRSPPAQVDRPAGGVLGSEHRTETSSTRHQGGPRRSGRISRGCEPATHQGHAQLHARIQEDTQIVAAASEVYAAAYRHAWTVLDSLSEPAGLPHPDFAPWVDGSYPPGLPPAELPPELAQIMSRTMTQLTEANQSRTSPRIDQPAARRFLDATRLLQRTSALTQAAEVRLTLLDGNNRSHLGVDDLLVDELIQHVRTRSEAQRNLDSWGFGHSPHS